ncbi:uncharacterized protein LOC142165830 [Nicotiana tabacum]|uniref:Uncharacterized protein LOC142165830 n=1 Tax=Nicotiana tabacum TaxID=4097 RepID=A0AC58S5P4_TOBAC
MNWLFWNVRGANKKYKQKELRKYLKTKHLTLKGITKTKVKVHKAHTVATVVAPNWGFQNNYLSAPNGRIWLLWGNSLYTVDKLREEAQLLHCQVTITTSNKPCVITIIYGYNTCDQRKDMREALKELDQGINMMWLIVGDFNAILYPHDRLFGNPVQYGEIKDFNDCIHDLMLNEVKYCGKSVAAEIHQLEDEKYMLNSQWSDNLVEKERTTLQNLEKWSLFEENIMKKKSRVKWIQLGDSNTKYFSVVVKERSQKKLIKEITSLEGMTLTEPNDIQEEIVNFYKSLIGSSTEKLPAINIVNMKAVLTLTQQQKLDLISPVSKEKIQRGLESIGEDKAPGIDGYNATFFKKAWGITKEEVCESVNEFFNNGKMYKAINCTAITLLPKNDKPTTVKEYRPIVCCTVLCKLISKAITTRLKKVIASLISESQANFIPERKIGDNIILSHELVKAYTRKHMSPRCMIK